MGCFSDSSIAVTAACMPRPAPPGPANEWHHEQVLAMDRSIRRIAGQALLPSPTASAAHSINLAARTDLIVLAHNSANPPQMEYATRAALDLLEVEWDDFVKTKWGDWRQDSASILDSDGQQFSFCNVILEKDGKRFELQDAVVWDIHASVDDPDAFGERLGQAIMALKSGVVEVQTENGKGPPRRF